MGPDRDFDLLGVEDVANNALFQSGTVLGYLVVEPIHLLDRLLRLRHIPQVLIAPLSDPGASPSTGFPSLSSTLVQASVERMQQPISRIIALIALLKVPLPSATTSSRDWLDFVCVMPVLE